jgi:hypothetical protein
LFEIESEEKIKQCWMGRKTRKIWE